MSTHPSWWRCWLMVLMVLAVAVPGVAACGNDYDDTGYVRPAPVVNPTTGERCTAWVNNPHEADGSGLRACDYPIPQTPPVRSPGMSDADFAMLGFLFGYGAGHSDFFFRPSYYDTYIGPAWSRYPGTYYGYGHVPVQRVGNVTVYNTTVVHNYDTRNATRITTARSDPRFSGYTDTRTGKSYTGRTVPQRAFGGSNIPGRSGGNASNVGGRSSSNSGNGYYSPSRVGSSSSGKGGYSGSSSGRGSFGGGRR